MAQCLAVICGLSAVNVMAEDYAATPLDELKPLLAIDWKLGPDYPMGIQDSTVGIIDNHLVSAGGYSAYPLDVVKTYPDTFGDKPHGFTKLALSLDLAKQPGEWKRIDDMPGPARQGPAVAVVDDVIYAMGGMNFDEPHHAYADTYRLERRDGAWQWHDLPATTGSGHERKVCRLPWPVYGGSGSTAVIGKKIYLVGCADYFRGPGGEGLALHSEAGRAGSPVGSALLVFDTTRPEEGWKRLADCPGVPKLHGSLAAVGGKIYQLGGAFCPLAFKSATDGQNSYNAVDSWRYDPETDEWTRLRDMPDGGTRRAVVYDDRYIVMCGGFKFPETWHVDGQVTPAWVGPERELGFNDFFLDAVLVYDTVTERLGTSNRMIEKTSWPGGVIQGDTIYCLGGEGGPRLYHPATLQIGKIVKVIEE